MVEEGVRSRLRRVLAGLSVVLLATVCFPPSPAVAERSGSGFALSGTVGVVRGPDSDAAALEALQKLLGAAGVRRTVVTDGSDPGTRVTVWLGQGDDALAALGAEDADGLTAEGYVLAAGVVRGGRAHVVLDGVDTDGTFYAVQDLRTRLVSRPGPDVVPALRAREAPRMRHRGVIEGFYGTPWSHQDRLAILDYLGAHRMNTYEYAPKDDPYHRERWRDPYPADKLAELGELTQRAVDNHVDLVFALSPGLSICYSSDADFAALTRKFDALYALGVRSFNVPLDDIDAGRWNCPADQQRYGSPGGAAAGRAQTDLLNRVQREWVEPKQDVAPLQMVPTEYSNVTDSPYKRAIRERLHPALIVQWTGVGVIPTTITRSQAGQARQVFGHEILIWDNYPVNDYIAGRLPLGPYTGREQGLADEVTGVISNPMNQAAVSAIALYSVAEFGWNDQTYDAERSFGRALSESAGGDDRVVEALRWFADLQYYEGTLHKDRAPRLSAALAAFWSDWDAGRTDQAAANLRPVLAAIAAAPATVRGGVVDPAFATEAKAWLDATELWAQAMQVSLDTLVAMAADEPGSAWTQRQRAALLVERARAIRDSRLPHSSTYPLIGDGVVDAFVAEVARRFDTSLGVGLDRPTAQTSLGTYAGNLPDRMLDGDPTTYFYSDAAPRVGDHVQVDLGKSRPIGDVTLLMSREGAPNDYLRSGVLEWSTDGSAWTELARGSQAEVRASAPTGTRARFVRYRALQDNAPYWLVVREFDVRVLDRTTVTVTGTPAPAAGSALADAADDDVGSSYVAGAGPQPGDALVGTLSTPRTVRRITVLQEGSGTAQGRVEVHTAVGWTSVGALTGAFTAVDVASQNPVDAVRLVWKPGTVPPRVAEIVPSYTD